MVVDILRNKAVESSKKTFTLSMVTSPGILDGQQRSVRNNDEEKH